MSEKDVEQPIKNLMPQHQDEQPGNQAEMWQQPRSEMEAYHAANKLKGKTALITGGDSGIGRAVAIGYAKEVADVAIVYLNEDDDAQMTKEHVEKAGRRCLLLRGDITNLTFCQTAVQQVVDTFGGLNILVNNAAEQHPVENFSELDMAVMERTFRTNIFAMFYLTQAALKHLKKGDCVINTTSITAYRGNPGLVDYSSTKGAILAFTRALAAQLAKKQIRVNAVAPGPIWTPLIPSTFSAMKVMGFGKETPMGRVGQPDEVAPAYISLASDDASYITGQTIHVNGGIPANG